ncbi:MAG: hypothetical protein CMJ19_05930 [Phycisphaeraceae bacterium]|nr:hypothetical protein [Phycisphaeraceae bacterium]
MSDISEVVVKYLKSDMTLEEQHKLSLWLDQHHKNHEILRNIENYWKYYGGDNVSAKKEVEDRIFERLQLKEPPKTRTVLLNPWLKVAAMLVVALAAIFSIYKLSFTDTPEAVQTVLLEKVALPGQKITTVLPDGTKVKLNSGSKLIVPEKFDSDKREIKLTGEAFFDVTRDPSRPFIIHTEKLDVEVLGTSFNVRAFSAFESLVAVKTGRVKVKSQGNESVELVPDQMVSMMEDGHISEVMAVNDQVFGWVDKELIFRNNQISEVIHTIENWYGVTIDINKNNLSDKPYTARFVDPALPEVMTSLSELYEFKYLIDDGKVIIR